MDNKEILRTFGLNIKFERTKLGLTQEKVAEILNFSSVYISNIEGGKCDLSLTNAYKIANFYKRTVDYFLKEKE